MTTNPAAQQQPSARAKSPQMRWLLAVGLFIAAGVGRAGPAEAEPQAWQSLFDGKSTAGWRGYNRKTFPSSGWTVQEGCLKLSAGGAGGNLITEATYENFVFEWEWKLPAAANNGVKYFVTENRPSAPGHEYQMVDDTTTTDPRRQTAAFYDVLPLQVKSPVKPCGQWNRSRILVQGGHVEHWLNDVKVLAYELGSPELKAALQHSKFKDEPGFGTAIRGHLMLTDHRSEAWFRNLRIRELPPPAARNADPTPTR
ncbi:MAG TPA: DUF1080 domain-containing protein [Verrucomicrobiota bacterium]|nr:DUF1080 domain-containing protein [Verrucomicrobiota bacterium]HNT14429.1 DUF1080 domain-containing protein [Verrucomicrobiota bacterium]